MLGENNCNYIAASSVEWQVGNSSRSELGLVLNAQL